jgi:hypothetical protein
LENKKFTNKKIQELTTELQYKKLQVIYKLFKENTKQYNYWKSIGETELYQFVSFFRSPIWDITNGKLFETGLISEGVKKESLGKVETSKFVKEHYIQRVKTSKILFECFSENKNLSFINFVNLLIKYGSTILVTKSEHSKITSEAGKHKDKFNYQIYNLCDVKIPGIEDHLKNLKFL